MNHASSAWLQRGFKGGGGQLSARRICLFVICRRDSRGKMQNLIRCFAWKQSSYCAFHRSAVLRVAQYLLIYSVTDLPYYALLNICWSLVSQICRITRCSISADFRCHRSTVLRVAQYLLIFSVTDLRYYALLNICWFYGHIFAVLRVAQYLLIYSVTDLRYYALLNVCWPIVPQSAHKRCRPNPTLGLNWSRRIGAWLV